MPAIAAPMPKGLKGGKDGKSAASSLARVRQGKSDLNLDLNPDSKFAPSLYPCRPSLRERSLGNQALMRLASPLPALVQRQCSCGATCAKCSGAQDQIQTKLRVGSVGDPYEREADQVAAQVLRLPSIPSQPAPSPMAASSPNHAAESPAPAPVANAAELTSGGQPLPPGLRHFFEAGFGRDFSEVRLHTGGGAEAWNDSLHAHAFTYGNHIWLGRGQSPAADFLMAHELAHVVQQRQPRPLARGDGPPGTIHAAETQTAAPAAPITPAAPAIQRLGLGDPFWIPLGAKGAMGGSAIHRELLGFAKTASSGIDIEAPAPNGDSHAWGLGLKGSIDLYQGSAMPGLYFEGRPKGQQNADIAAATPTKHPKATLKGTKAGNFKPFVESDKIKGTQEIKDIDQGPTEVKLGEFKPAVQSMLDKGDGQLDNYALGMMDAARLTNAWAAKRGKAQSWKLAKPGRLPDAAVKFNDGSKDLKFDPANPRDDKTLVLGTVSESRSIGGKYEVSVRFNPAEHGLDPIKGGLYAQRFTGGKDGLWMYFARPKDLKAAMALPRSTLIKGEMEWANQVQDKVVNPLLKAPEQASKMSRARAKENALPISQGAPLLLRRAPKPPKLKDDFNLKTWAKDQAALNKTIHHSTDKDQKKKLASLEFLEMAYKTEESLSRVSGTGKSTLPDKAKDQVKIETGTGKDKKTSHRKLGDIFGWLSGWSSKPAAIIGRLRDTFGSTFVVVINKFTQLEAKVKAKLKEHFDAKADIKGKSGKAALILKALGKALKQVAKILVPRTLNLVMDAVEAGIKKKVAKLFDIDPVRMLEEKFEAGQQKVIDLLEAYKKKADDFVAKAVEEYAKELAWIKDVVDMSKTIGPIIEAAAFALQCATPPGWGCLKLLAKKLTDCAIAKAMNICRVQKEIAEKVAALGPLANLPAFLADKVMKVLKKAAPPGLEDIFDEPIGKSGTVDPKEVECEFTPLDKGCPNSGLIELDGGEGAPESGSKDKGKDGGGSPNPGKGQGDSGSGKPPSEADLEKSRKMREFVEKLTDKQLKKLAEEAERQGLNDKPFDPKQAEEMHKKLEEEAAKEKQRQAEKDKANPPKPKNTGKPPEKGGAKGPSAPAPGKGTQGDGSGSGGKCVWDTGHLMPQVHVLQTDSMGSQNILNYGDTSTPFSKTPITGDCHVSLTIKNDFTLANPGCDRPGKHAKPILTTEIIFNKKELFKKTDSNPWTNGAIARPKWDWFIPLDAIRESGTLQIKVTLTDPDTGVVKVFDDKVDIKIVTEGKCCNCIV